ncbi:MULTISPECIES: SspB family protein [unclassified Lentilitoribacter]|jgi:hypothetical protein|uniref:SspB family protein n=1 Tax=unclassified Lentilitoribacter TaxID=2647570 RepID=UPI0013A6E8DB|nr:SspB family protein [Lentilitoribacter sp. Alg239-R112]
MSQDQIRYDILAQEALRGVIKKVLIETAAAGQLPGEHHFFITFLTTAPGVRISSALQERYPDQMTIVVQHQFWELKVTDTLFEIGLSFSDQPEKLVVPFSAIRGFYDPSVNFELEFDNLITEEEQASEDQADADVQTLETKPVVIEDKTSDDDDEKEQGDASADVVSLDAFRKKT